MLDPKLLKENSAVLREMLRKRNIDFPLDELISLDRHRRELIVEIQDLRQKKNRLSETIALKKRSGKDPSTELSEMKIVGVELERTEQERMVTEENFNKLGMLVPNLLHNSVPEGKDEKDNVVVKTVGNIQSLPNPKDHVDIAMALDLIDLERAAKISGARFFFLKNELVRMNIALISFALDFISKKGYSPVQPPFMIRREPMEGAVILGDFEDVIYKVEDEDLYMIGTSEHALAGMHMGEIIEGKRLPLRYAGVSPCFRKEAGAHGKDMKGIFRVHQFDKVEQFVYCKPEDSDKEHERMLSISQEFIEKLGLPYRTVLLCSGDTGKISAKTYDLEVWMPGQQSYREIISCSNCLDFQARRLRIRFRDKTNEGTSLVHTLNSTLVAVQRTLVAIIENYQTSVGSILVPDALQAYMNDTKEIVPQN